MIAAAMLDRLLHHSAVLHIDGESYRIRAHRARAEALRKVVAPRVTPRVPPLRPPAARGRRHASAGSAATRMRPSDPACIAATNAGSAPSALTLVAGGFWMNLRLGQFQFGGQESWPSAVFTSMYAFHGRGLGPGLNCSVSSGSCPLTFSYGWGAVESLVGLLLEITFIATFTQRLLRR